MTMLESNCFICNGAEVEADVEPRTTTAEALREELALTTYLVPTATDIPRIEIKDSSGADAPDRDLREFGEGSAVIALAAVDDALRPYAVKLHDFPLTPKWISRAVRGESWARDPR